MIALILYLILAATLEFGRALFGAQVLQQAADVAAREISRTTLPPAQFTLQDVLYSKDNTFAGVRQSIFDESLLQIPYATITDAIGNAPLVQYFDDKPIVNRLLFPLMIITTDNKGNQVLSYPGIQPVPNPSPNGNQFQIAVVSSYTQGPGVFDGSEGTIGYVPVIQEIRPDPSDATVNGSPFNLAATNPKVALQGWQGLVALRINYPFQAATMSATAPNPPGSRLEPNAHFIAVPADDEVGAAPGPYSGSSGLGIQYAAGRTVRPFRRLISAQSIYRREVFGP